jgi:hypothetical protein
MRACCSLLLAGALLARAAGAAPEGELQAGYLTGANYGNPFAPVLGVRAGVDFDDRFTLSLRGALAHSDPVDYVGDGSRVNPSGVRGWSALFELRIHTTGLFQLHAAGALGVAQVTTWQCSCVESLALHGKPAVAAQLSAGARFMPGSSPRLSLRRRGGPGEMGRPPGLPGELFSPGRRRAGDLVRAAGRRRAALD